MIGSLKLPTHPHTHMSTPPYSLVWLIILTQLLAPQACLSDAPPGQSVIVKTIISADGKPLAGSPASTAAPAEPPGSVQVILTDASGKPISRDLARQVEIWSWVVMANGSVIAGRAGVTVGEGFVSVRPVLSWDSRQVLRMLLEARVPGVGIGSGRTDGGPGPISISLHPGATLQAEILDKNHKSAPYAGIVVQRLSEDAVQLGSGFQENARAGVDGRIRLTDLFPERCLLEVQVGQDRCWREVDLSGGSAEVTLSPADPPPGGSEEDLLTGADYPWVSNSPLAATVWARADPDGFKNLPLISGHVRQKDGSPAVDRSVLLMEQFRLPVSSTRTAADGSFVMRAPDKGTYYPVVPGSWAVCSGAIKVQGARTLSPDLIFTPVPTVSVTLLAPDGPPLPQGSRVTVYGWLGKAPGASYGAGSSQRSLHVGRGGAVVLAGIPLSPESQASLAGSGQQVGEPSRRVLDATVEAPGVGGACLVRQDWPAQPVTLRLHPYHVLAGRLLDSAGRPVMGAHVELEHASQRWPPGSRASEATTDGHGRFEMGSLIEDRYAVTWTTPADQAAAYKANADEAKAGSGLWSGSIALVSPRWSAALPVQLRGLRTEVILTPYDEAPTPWSTGYGPPDDTAEGDDESASFVPHPLSAAVAGRVLSLTGGQPVPGALVLLYAPDSSPAVADALTGPDGSFQLSAPGPGTYRVLAANRGGKIADRPVVVSPGHSTRLDLRVHPNPTIRLSLLAPSGTKVVESDVAIGVSLVSARRQSAELLHGAQDTAGVEVVTPQFPDVPENIDEIDLWIRAANFGCATVRLHSWPDAPITVHLHAGLALTGQVVDSDGKPVAGARVHFWPWILADQNRAADGGLDVLSMANGVFVVYNVPSGPYTISTAGSQGQSNTLTGVLPECGAARIPGSPEPKPQQGPRVIFGD